MKIIKRKECVICKGKLNEVHTFENFPIFMGVSKESVETDINKDMIFSECGHCGCIQLANLIPLDILYENPHNAAIGKTWDKHHYEFYQFIKKYAKGTVVEIGGGNLKLAKHLENEESVDKIFIYDSNLYENYKSGKIHLKEGFFDSQDLKEEVDIVIHSHLLEHLYSPVEELKDMSSLLSDGSYMAIAVPLIDEMLKDNFTNAMNFEHTYMTTYSMIESMLNMAGLNIVDNKNFSPYITFIMAEKTKIRKNVDPPFLRDNIKILNDFLEYYTEEVKTIKQKIDSKKENTFIFGAHIFTQYLFGFGLEEKLFSNVLDNDPAKINNRLYGTSLKVRSPEILRNIENPVVILKAAMYTEEIKKDILENINSNTRFIL